MNAFNYLKLIDGFETESIKSLLEAKGHHNWRFSKFAKDVLRNLESKDEYKTLITQLKSD
jgi:aminopeptidase N